MTASKHGSVIEPIKILPESQTHLIYGAPGAGKTTTLGHLRRQWVKGSYVTQIEDGSAREGPTPLMLFRSGTNALANPVLFCQDLANLIVPGIGDKQFSSEHKTRRILDKFNLGAFTGSVEKEHAEIAQHSDQNFDSWCRLLLGIVPIDKWKRPIVIGIDETQNLSENKNSFVGQFIQGMHDNVHSLPLILVMGGLSDSVTRVEQLGLTRLSENHTHSLDCLDEVELKEFKAGFLEHFDLDLGDRERDFDEILESSSGWPAHLQNGLQSFAKDYVEAKGDIEKVNFDAIHKLNHEKRTRYHARRMSREMRRSSILLASIMKRVTRNQEEEVINIINQCSEKWASSSRGGKHLPTGMTAEDYYDHLIHRGALQESDDGWVACPIPSFRQFILGLSELR